jgi:hypothetical protein
MNEREGGGLGEREREEEKGRKEGHVWTILHGRIRNVLTEAWGECKIEA